MKGLRERFEVTGDHIEYLMEWLHGKNVNIYGVKMIKNGLILTIDYKDRKKLFAISSNMCYNIRKIGYTGKFAPFKYVADRIGILIGAALFLAAIILTDGIVVKFSYKGDAVYLEKEIDAVLESEGVKEWSYIGGEECGKLRSAILSSSDKFSYVSVEKKGHKLIIEAYKAYESVVPLDTKKEKIVATKAGKVNRITVLSGTALVNVGDEVKEGDVLIDGSYTHNESTGTTYALGEVEIAAEYVYEYSGVGDADSVKSRAITLAIESLGCEATVKDVRITDGENGNICIVTLEYFILIG